MVTAAVARDLGEIERSRGRYKIFLGMAAGVGKTYRMLQEGQAAAEDGRDVAIGYLEPHGRVETLVAGRGPGGDPAPDGPLPRRDDGGDGPARSATTARRSCA